MSFVADEAKRDAYFARVELEYEKEVAKLFRDALDDIRSEMAKIYDKYAVDGVLTKAQMTRYNRLATLEKNIIAIMKPVVKNAKALVNRLKPIEYGEAFWRTAWAFDNETGVALSWGTLDKNAIAASLSNVFHEVALRNWGAEALGRIRTAINNGLAVGQSYTAMMRDMKQYINAENYRIMRILRTELHDAQEAGTSAGYDAALNMGIDGKVVWLSALDGRTRPDHAAMDGKERADDGMFHGAIGQAPYPGWEGLPAEERINCITGDAIPIGVDVEKLYKRWYDGKLVHIKTASGLDLRVTPNHPILTDIGWVSANKITKNHNLVSVNFGKQFDSLDMDINYSPPIASKIFDLFRIVSVEKMVAGANHQFHGDGRDGDVDVESIDGKLWNSFQSAFYKPLIKRVFTHTNILKRLLSGNGALDKLRFFAFYAAHSIMRFASKVLTFFRAGLRHPKVHGLGTIPGFDAVPKKYFANSPTINLELFCYRLFGESFKIETDKITFIGNEAFSGHVYNLQSKYDLYGVYNNNGRMSIVHNCRCTMRFEIEGFPPLVRRSRDDGVIPYQTYNDWRTNRRLFA